MAKKIITFILLVSLLLCFSACRSDSPYTIYEKDGRYYMNLGVAETEPSTAETSIYAISVEEVGGNLIFSSIAEMKQCILSGDIDEVDVAALRRYSAEDGIWEICNMDILYDVTLPISSDISSVALRGTSYHVSANSDFFSACGIDCFPQEQYCDEYNKDFQEEYVDFPNLNVMQRVTWCEEIEDRNATQIFYENHTGQYKVIKYVIEEAERTLYVVESYCLTRYNDLGEADFIIASEIVPKTLDIFIEDNGAYAHIWVFRPVERPSVEWITSFGMIPFEG